MQIDIQTKNFTLLEIQGNVIGQDALVLKTMLDEHIQELQKQNVKPMLIFNMAHVQTIDSAGLGVLITTSTQIRQMGGRVVLLNLKQEHQTHVDPNKPNITFRFSQEPRGSNNQHPLIFRLIPCPIRIPTVLQRINQ